MLSYSRPLSRSFKALTYTVNQRNDFTKLFLRSLATEASPAKSSSVSTRAQKAEGAILEFFSTLDPSASHDLPPRFADLKAELWHDGLLQSWKEVLAELEVETERLASLGTKAIPRVSYDELRSGLSKENLASIKHSGVVVVTGAVPKEEALSWKQSILDYVNLNRDRVRGFPAEDPQIFELYNTKAQTLARTHPNILNTQKSLLGLWHTSDPRTEISLDTPISYFDRLRIRKPGDMKFTLGPHIDGGSIERWEDPQYRSCWTRILRTNWREHDPFDVSPRVGANQDLYHAANQCSIFRPWQGWTSMSTTRQNEGTLKVLPMLSLSTAYVILRPFFRPKYADSTSLKFEDWVPDVSNSLFPGSGMGKGQELNEMTHPHLKLDKTMIPIPLVEPGDQVYWHCDVVHAVEYQHRGSSDSSVMYIPAVPLTEHNAGYLRDQRIHFVEGLPAPDFPGGKGESQFIGRGNVNDIKSRLGLQAFGFEPFEEAGSEFVKKANSIISA
ncbi:hypothetical protein GYMLUDRAFT_45222 [Collybiopsis luxurians FD-317 M1]|uniref:DUF1479-domain-containing protein n=1 Tax=Collybiopsis luxurians FD-317 M1 TaxID=944289 RepID=A0A0D0BTB6_9AGAR|nr:hypothetical protein GYMLUDRAFT_45222 [Collybiopsis luxurians FD-317 M1]